MKKIVLLVLCVSAMLVFTACKFGVNKEDKPNNLAASGSYTSKDTYGYAASSAYSSEWKTAADSTENSDIANRKAFGIIDSNNGIFYYQGECEDDCLYALYSYDSESDDTRLLAKDCYGMINATAEGVYYIGHVDKGLYRYDYNSAKSKKLCSGDIVNTVVCEKSAYIITSDNILYMVNLYNGDKLKIAENVACDYLEVFDDCLYYSQNNSDNLYDLYKASIENPDDRKLIASSVPMPIKCCEDKVFCKSNSDITAVDIDSGEMSILIEDKNIFSAAVKGNCIYYTHIDSSGNSELFAFDTETNQTAKLTTAHCAAVYCMDSEIYLVDVVDFRVEKVILSQGSASTQWLIK